MLEEPEHEILFKDEHCSFCGNLFANNDWPRTCGFCLNVTYRNPIPVVVALIPVTGMPITDECAALTDLPTGFVTIRRGIQPGKGLLALPGGFLDYGETWQAGTVREVKEECDLDIDPSKLRLVTAASPPDGKQVHIYSMALPITYEQAMAIPLNAEVTEVVVLDEPLELAFPLHTEVLEQELAQLTAVSRRTLLDVHECNILVKIGEGQLEPGYCTFSELDALMRRGLVRHEPRQHFALTGKGREYLSRPTQ